ncbi:hypothetical protein GGR56DRAFT_614486 [Xylariaceae sp. FL0804]|nr:hypothetical protein GGR56DRAFT_614486 [Xylariaceae sp. FL0804]
MWRSMMALRALLNILLLASLVAAISPHLLLRQNVSSSRYCELGAQKRLTAGNGSAAAPDIAKRAPSEPHPLLALENFIPTEEGRKSKKPKEVLLFERLKSLAPRNTNQDIDIHPSDKQLRTWVVDGIPVGATGKWYAFGNEPLTWQMRALHGCTAIFVMSPNGFWAGHLWEGSTEINGGSAFEERIALQSDDAKKDKYKPRTQQQFQKIAVDILTQATPANQVKNREHWQSLEDLRLNAGDPFADPETTEILVFTKAISAVDRAVNYQAKITSLVRGLKSALNLPQGTKSTPLTYPTEGGKYTEVNGEVVLQYTPYEKDDLNNPCGGRIAAARIWAYPESEKGSVRGLEWLASSPQLVKGNSSCTSNTTSTATPAKSRSTSPATTPQPPTTTSLPPTPTPSCYQQLEDPDQGINTVYCVCDETRTEALITNTAFTAMSQSCHYTSLPPKDQKRTAWPHLTTAMEPPMVTA